METLDRLIPCRSTDAVPSAEPIGAFGGVFSGRRVLVTGATGFKGSWLCAWLGRLGADVCGLSLDLPGNPCHFATLGLEREIRDRRADIRDPGMVGSVVDEFQPEIVVHLAAQALVRRSYEEPALTFATNVLGTVNLLEALRHCPAVRAAVIVTSDKCYENVEQTAGYHERDRLGGKDPYSASKGCAEIVFSSYARGFFGAPNRWAPEESENPPAGPLLASARAGNVIGGGDWAADRIVPDCVRAWMAGQAPVLRHPQATRPWQHVLEPLSGYLWLAARLFSGAHRLHGDSFNFGPRPEVNETVLRLVELLRDHWPEAAAPEVRPPAIVRHEAGLLRLNCAHACEQLGWQATLNFAETARFTSEWYRTYQVNPGNARACTLRQIQAYVALAQDRGIAWATHSP